MKNINNLDIVIKLFLVSSMAPISEERLNTPIVETCVRYYILGVIDFAAQLNNLDDKDFYTLVESVFGEFYNDLKNITRPETKIFISLSEKNIIKYNILKLSMEEGGKSFKRFLIEKDADAPLDFGRLIIFLENQIADNKIY